MTRNSKTLNAALFLASAIAALIAGVPAAYAEDAVRQQSISEGLNTPDAKQRLDGSVKFYFGSTQHPAVLKSYGEVTTNQKSNSFGKADEMACNRAFLSALIKFQSHAQQLGANAVVNIHSFFKKQDVSSETQIPCYTGFLMAGITLKGEFVKIADR